MKKPKSAVAIILFSLVISVQSRAEFVVDMYGGMRQGSIKPEADIFNTYTTEGAPLSYQLGARAKFQFEGPIGFVTGGGFTQRHGSASFQENAPIGEKVNFSVENLFLDLPLWVQLQISEQFYAWAGPTLAINLNSKCNVDSGYTCNHRSTRKLTIPLIIGVGYRFNPHFGLEIFFEDTQSGKSEFGGIDDYEAYGLNFVYSL